VTDHAENSEKNTDFREYSSEVRVAMKRFQMRLQIEKLKKRVADLEYENARLERRAKRYAEQLDAAEKGE